MQYLNIQGELLEDPAGEECIVVSEELFLVCVVDNGRKLIAIKDSDGAEVWVDEDEVLDLIVALQTAKRKGWVGKVVEGV